MHSGPTHNRDSVEDWKTEVEECLRFMDEVDPTLAQYVDFLESLNSADTDGTVGGASAVGSFPRLSR